MSLEEDYLMAEVAKLRQRADRTDRLFVEAGMLHECTRCTTPYAPDLAECPECGLPRTAATQEDVERFEAQERGETVNYSDLKADELKAELKRRDLATDGVKADLVARLEQDDQARAEAKDAE